MPLECVQPHLRFQAFVVGVIATVIQIAAAGVLMAFRSRPLRRAGVRSLWAVTVAAVGIAVVAMVFLAVTRE